MQIGCAGSSSLPLSTTKFYVMVKIESEKVIERKLVNMTNDLGGMCIKLLSFHCIGLPDRLCLFPGGRLVFVELKTTKQKPRKIQLLRHSFLRALGFRVEVVDTIAGVEKLINDYKDRFKDE